MIIDEVYTYLLDQLDDLTSSNTFKSFMPDEPDDIVSIYNTGGAEPSRDIPTGEPTFQVMVRNTDYETGEQLIDSIADLLHRKRNLELVEEETYFYYIYLMGEPGHIGRDDNNRDEWSVNFHCRIRR